MLRQELRPIKVNLPVRSIYPHFYVWYKGFHLPLKVNSSGFPLFKPVPTLCLNADHMCVFVVGACVSVCVGVQ